MRLFGRTLLVCVVVCLALLPAPSEAAIIGPATPLGDIGFETETEGGSLFDSGDIALLFSFTVDQGTLLTVDVSAGFDTVLTLFGPVLDSGLPTFQNTFQYVTDSDRTAFNDPVTEPLILTGGSYLLALTQWPNLFEPVGALTGFSSENDPTGFDALFAQCPFVSRDGECVPDGGFSVTLSVEQTVPEPATLSLLTLGAAALVAERRRRRSTKEDTA